MVLIHCVSWNVSLTAHDGESRGQASLHMTEPRSRQPQAAIHCISWNAFGDLILTMAGKL